MTYRTPVRARSLYCLLGSILLLAIAIPLLSALLRPTVAGGAPPIQADPAKVMGVKACLDCHKPEVAAWQVSRHAVNLDKLGDNPNAKKYAAALGITDANITREGLCIDCHGQRAQATANRTTAIGGNRASSAVHESPLSSEIHNPPLVEPKARRSPLSSTASAWRHTRS